MFSYTAIWLCCTTTYNLYYARIGVARPFVLILIKSDMGLAMGEAEVIA